MKILANDGKECATVEECIKYEKQLEVTAREDAEKEFFKSLGLEVVDTREFNELCNRTSLIFDKKGNIDGLKSCGGGALERNGINYDFRYMSGDDESDEEVMCNWLRNNKLYGHALSSFRGRTKEWYEKTLLGKLENLGWEVKNEKLADTAW